MRLRFRRHPARELLLAASVALCACSPAQGKSPSATKADDEDPWAKRAWIQKVGTTLLLGSELSVDEVEALAAKPRQEIVAELMQDPRFGETVLDFNLYFLGFKPAKLYSESVFHPGARLYDEAIRGKPQALTSARALMAGGDYFSLFDVDQPYYGVPYNPAIPFDPYAGGAALPGTPAEVRAHFLGIAMARHDGFIAELAVPEGGDPVAIAKTACEHINARSADLFNDLIYSGLSLAHTTEVFYELYFDTLNVCFSDSTVDTAAAARATLETSRTALASLIASFDHYAPENATARSLQDIEEIDPATIGLPGAPRSAYSTPGFWAPLPNSSTNFDRKRAAYVLKTYFCDDLTPINIAQPETGHQSDRHASDPGCQACHYKLDPMAGFFRYRGVMGADFEGKGFLLFDDFASVSGDALDRYLATWRAPEGSGREWNVAYIRSPDPAESDLNSYGSSLDDLGAIIKTAPEVKQCLVKRMASYFLGDHQVYDGAWLASLTDRLEVRAGDPPGRSSAAFKEIVGALVQSNAFSVPDPQPDQCYDSAPGEAPSPVPCPVRFVLQNNCVTCHNARGASGGLRLDDWITLADGSQTFAHVDEHGAQLSRSESLARVLGRISTTDPDLQMPKMQYMSAGDRARLYEWVNAQLSEGGSTP
jgi:hypothetical protein